MQLIQRLANFGRLGRIGMAPLTVSVPILGALSAEVPFSPGLSAEQIIGLGALGLCAHLFGFALNDLIDYPLDATLPNRCHPLVTGELSRRDAWLFTLFQVPLAFGIYLVILRGSNAGLFVVCMSILCSVIYNLWSKRSSLHRFLPELALAVSIGLLCGAGALIRADSVGLPSLLFALTLTFVLLSVNSVPSGLKDLKTDYEFGARSFVLVAGAQMLDDDQMIIHNTLRIYSLLLQVMILVGLLCVMVSVKIPLALGVLIGGLALYGGLHLRLILSLRSYVKLRRAMPLLSGYYHYVALALCLINWMPAWLQIAYAIATIALILLPWRLSLRMWRGM